MKRARHSQGSVVFDRRRDVWNYLYCDGGVRHTRTIGPTSDYPTKAQAWAAVVNLKGRNQTAKEAATLTVRDIAKRYESERMPTRKETRRVYLSFMNNHVLPRWGHSSITALQPRDVELWLRQLNLSPKTRTHVRNLLHILVDYAMWAGILELARNPLDLVQVKGATKRIRKPRSLTLDEFRRLSIQLQEPVRTLAIVSACLGLRVSEALGLRWSDIDWLGGTVTIERAVVRQHVDDTKNDGSRQTFTLAPELLESLKAWRQATQFPKSDSWLFASSVQIGRKPISYTEVRRELRRAAAAAGIGHLSTHSFRHSFRTWIDSLNTPVGVQQRLMRHASITTTMNQYGDALVNDMRQAHEKVANLALRQ